MLSRLSNMSDVVNGPILFVTAITVVFMLGITVAMVYFTVRYNRRRNPKPSEIHGHIMLEIVWMVVPMALALGMFWYGWVGYDFMKSPPDDAIQVEVTARMWSWTYEYENGVQTTDALRVPVNKPVKLNLKALDVLHSYYIPAFKIKQDAVPGVDGLYLWFTALQEGSYVVMCAEYCGLQHSTMLSEVRVLPEDEYHAWLAAEGEKVAEMEAALAEGGGEGADLIAIGERLSQTKGCIACHSTDGTRLVGPTYQRLFGRTEMVVTNGQAREIVVDEEYLRKSMLDPNADIVEGFPPLMPSQEGLVTEEEINALIEYMKSVQ